MFIQTEATPNPDTLKFLPGREVSPGTPFQFDSLDDSAPSPLAKALFQLKNVSSVFLGADYVAVSKTEAADWAVLKPQVLAAIMEEDDNKREELENRRAAFCREFVEKSGDDVPYELRKLCTRLNQNKRR